ncbi:MAG: patatin-like phospholipase family protein [Chitinophagaceae bacterium]|nr:patatin-like phospholipase family protein [Chitinophagaceae bacterium]
MKQVVKDIFYSFPIQLFILHFRKYQVLLIFWYILVSTVNSGFMKSFGADALFFSPEYLDKVNALGAAIVGTALGVFVMSWNITTFILHSKRCKFLATTSEPFLKYCINNALLPLCFLIFYIIKLYQFNEYKELMGVGQIIIIISGILAGFFLLISFSFAYFFGAEKTIQYRRTNNITNPPAYKAFYNPVNLLQQKGFGMKVSFYFNTRLQLRKARNAGHYSQSFLDTIFKRHHFAAMISIVLAFIFLVAVGFLLDNIFFQLPAAASILVFFAVMIAVIGALTYFLQSWSLPAVILFFVVLNILYQKQIIDPRNKAYGINYTNVNERPSYNKQSLQQLCMPEKILADKSNMISILNKWKAKQHQEKPVMVFINVSGGGLRSAAFVMNMLQKADSVTKGKLFNSTFMITGASGGMLSAAYYREVYRNKQKDSTINLHNTKYADNISKDMLNSIFSSMIARDIFAPAQKFTEGNFKYIKDRGYSFEQRLKDNTGGILNKPLKDYVQDEKNAAIPLMIFNSVISRDGRKMMASTQPISFMMKPANMANDNTVSPDAVDFAAMFARQDPLNLRLLTALRMNATFPYVLPNVWLPSEPVIDVMDAGIRDNYGQETTLRFIENFKNWIDANTSGVVILQIRDRVKDNWHQPFVSNSISDILIKPATMLQSNWYKLQDFFQTDQFSYFNEDNPSIQRISFMYVPQKEEQGAALNFHLTAREKRDIIASFYNSFNQASLQKVVEMIK